MDENELDLSFSRLVKNSLQIKSRLGESSIVYLVAIAKKSDLNKPLVLSLKGGMPVSNFLYDSQSDSYLVEGHSFVKLGIVPISFQLTVKDNPNWIHMIPMSENIIKKYLNSEQKKMLKEFKSKYKSNSYNYAYFQAISCY